MSGWSWFRAYFNSVAWHDKAFGLEVIGSTMAAWDFAQGSGGSQKGGFLATLLAF